MLQRRPPLWFERLFRRLGLGTIGGSLLIGGGGFALLSLISYFIGGQPAFVQANAPLFIVVSFILITLVNFGSSFIATRIEELKTYAVSLGQRPESVSISVLYGTKYPMVVVLLLQLLIQPIFFFTVFPSSFSAYARIVISLPYFYWGFFIGSFMWVYSYSLYCIYKLGRGPLTLRPFTEDRTLGLRPFGRASLLLTGIYLSMVTVLTVPQLVEGFVNLPLLTFTLALLALAFAFFLLPLGPLRAKMLQAKVEASAIAGPRYTRAVASLRARGDDPVDDSLANELAVVEKIQKDTHQIHSWPFDVGILARLTAILFSIVAILLASYLRTLLHF